MKKLLFFVLICISVTTTHAEDKETNSSPWSGGVTLGGSNFLRTFNVTGKTGINHYDEDLNFSVGLSAIRTLNDVISMEGEWTTGKLSGTWNDSKYPQTPPSTYESNFNQFAISGLFNLNKLIMPNNTDYPWHVFGKAGVGTSFLNGNTGGTSDSHVSLIVPVGLGVNYKVNDKFDVALASTVNFGNDWLNSGQEWVASGNTYMETFLNTGIKVSYRFNDRKKRKAIPAQKTPSTVKVQPKKQEKTLIAVTPNKSTSAPKQVIVENKVVSAAPVQKVEIMEEVVAKRAIVARPGWKIDRGVIFGELPVEGIIYRVQVLAAYKKMISESSSSKDLSIKGPFIEYHSGNIYKYAVNKNFSSYKAAKAFSDKLNKTGKYKDTFVVAFKNDLQIK